MHWFTLGLTPQPGSAAPVDHEEFKRAKDGTGRLQNPQDWIAARRSGQ